MRHRFCAGTRNKSQPEKTATQPQINLDDSDGHHAAHDKRQKNAKPMRTRLQKVRCTNHQDSSPNNPSPHPQHQRRPHRSQNKRCRRSNNNNTNARHHQQIGMSQLAAYIVDPKQSVVVWITGAGLSVASGIRPFRGSSTTTNNSSRSSSRNPPNNTTVTSVSAGNQAQSQGLWDQVLWTMATRAAFRKDPVRWYSEFWNVYFSASNDWGARGSESSSKSTVVTRRRPEDLQKNECNVTSTTADHQPNAGHLALDQILRDYSNCRQITQNIDGLQKAQNQLVEVHGRLGLYKCCPDSDSDDDEDDELSDNIAKNGHRPVVLGHRGKSKKLRLRQQQHDVQHGPYPKSTITRKRTRKRSSCPFQFSRSLTSDQLGSQNSNASSIANRLHSSPPKSTSHQGRQVPRCPTCDNVVMPQALLFDEGYHSHSFYQFEVVEDWLAAADVLVFVGTSLPAVVQLTAVALRHARQAELPVFNFNIYPYTQDHSLNVTNIVGPAAETLPLFLAVCQEMRIEENPSSNEYRRKLRRR